MLLGASPFWLEYVDQVLDSEYWLPPNQRSSR
ncbi:MAG: hypothetical protein AVDCRST_MAG77-4740 [uncultured Chloroflexi bacterium]|uniref:Uncharacterized protein n=1 Tax=uncultured Chloroflexota bacterium TaxID=166587 RepID=A0A6J4JZ59_9CHLR|nr:MAG: hypothetical protein AVDCRST_MAG77-4740 [uncultured Chloroflexota bacterium]